MKPMCFCIRNYFKIHTINIREGKLYQYSLIYNGKTVINLRRYSFQETLGQILEAQLQL